MKKTVYLHIGIGKTGTTSIQKVLQLNYSTLKKNGVLYPQTGLASDGHHNLAILGQEQMGGSEHKLYKSLIIEIQSSSCNNIILSSENFIFMKKIYIKEIHKYFSNFDIKIIVYVREQVSLLESTYLEWVKTEKPYGNNIDSFFSIHKNSFNYTNKIKIWTDIFGEKSILARLFHKEIIGEDVSVDFLSLLNIKLNLKSLKKFENDSLIPDVVDILCKFDSQNIDSSLRKKITHDLLVFSKKYKKYLNSSLVSNSLKQIIIKEYLESNIEFSNKFLTNEEKKIFINSK